MFTRVSTPGDILHRHSQKDAGRNLDPFEFHINEPIVDLETRNLAMTLGVLGHQI